MFCAMTEFKLTALVTETGHHVVVRNVTQSEHRTQIRHGLKPVRQKASAMGRFIRLGFVLRGHTTHCIGHQTIAELEAVIRMGGIGAGGKIELRKR